jgi:putative acetyltransferase
VELRQERRDDLDAIRDVHRRAFGDQGTVVAALVDALREKLGPDERLSLVAVNAGRVAGHVMFTRNLLDAPRKLVDVRVLSPLGVLPEHQRRGIGSALVRRGLAEMGEQAVPLVFLEGDPRYYSRFGFMAGGEHGFRKPSLRTPDAAFQVFRLPTYEPWMTGTLVYSEVFWELDTVGLRDPDA